MKNLSALMLAAAACLTLAQSADAQQFPSHAVTIVVPYGPGGPTDSVARVLADGLSRTWGQPVVVENRAGAGGNIGSDRVARSAPDGHTLLVIPSGVMVINPLLFKSMPLDPLKDLAPISQLGSGPIIMFVSSTLPVKNMAEFIDYAKKNPGKLNFTSPGVGTIPHLAGEMLMQETGIKMVHVPFLSAPQATASVVSGDGQVIFDSTSSMTYAAAGKLKPILVMDNKRWSGAPDLPTSKEAGFPNFTVDAWYAIAAPAKTSPEILKKIQTDSAAVLKQQAAIDRLSSFGFTPLVNTPDEFSKAVNTEAKMWQGVFKAAGIQPQ